ncbi:MAG: heavy metal-binding domain-containing protein [Dehalococcoidia bacterium]
MNMKMCLNWKVIGGLAVVGAGIWILDPKLIAAAFPLLLLAACPLSMLLMMGGMGKMGGMKQEGDSGAYRCPMHPRVQSDQPGRCSSCGMSLVQTESAKQVAQAAPTNLTDEDRIAELKNQLTAMGEQQQRIAQEIARLEPTDTPIVREAERVARAADKR